MDSAVASGPMGDEQALLTRLRNRDEAAFSHLVDRLHGPLLRLALAHVSSRGVAEEVVQETWLAVLDGLDRFEGRSSLKTWIFRILTNRAKTRGVREKRSVPFSSLGSADDGDGGHDGVDPARFENGMWSAPPRSWQDPFAEQLLITGQAMAQLEAALQTLPAQQRVVVVLRDVEGLDAEAVCNILEITETNQRVLLHRARTRLRAALEAFVDRNRS